MALILSRRSGEAVDLFIGDDPLGSITPRFDPDFPGLVQLHFALSKDITILRRELSRRKGPDREQPRQEDSRA